jgi:hypothetical protein
MDVTVVSKLIASSFYGVCEIFQPVDREWVTGAQSPLGGTPKTGP